MCTCISPNVAAETARLFDDTNVDIAIWFFVPFTRLTTSRPNTTAHPGRQINACYNQSHPYYYGSTGCGVFKRGGGTKLEIVLTSESTYSKEIIEF